MQSSVPGATSGVWVLGASIMTTVGKEKFQRARPILFSAKSPTSAGKEVAGLLPVIVAGIGALLAGVIAVVAADGTLDSRACIHRKSMK
jgi:hypothetical protein